MASYRNPRTAMGAIVLMFVLVLPGSATSALIDKAEAKADTEAVSSSPSPDGGGSDGESDRGSEPPPPAPSGPLSKLQVHGFLSQAYATSSFQEGGFPPPGPTAEELALGIPEDGTTNYRTMAIQFRYEISPRDVMILQFSSRALGFSPITDIEDEVELDWAFYERRIGDNTSIKVGKVLIPLGIFNEIRDVGTLLPFYRVPFVFYREGAFTSETVDGVDFSHTIAPGSAWSVGFDAYFGEWDLVEIDPLQEAAALARAEDSWGTQLWLNTPISGLRWGLGYQRREVTEGLEGIFRPEGGSTKFDDWWLSLDAVFNRFVFRAETRYFENDPTTIPVLFANDYVAEFNSWYAQFGFHPSPSFRIYLQYEQSDAEAETVVFTEKQELTLREDLGIAINYLLSPNVVLKAEYHEVEGEDQSFIPVFGPGGFQLQPIYSDLEDGSYTVISLSASF